jgi:hypothetical protein
MTQKVMTNYEKNQSFNPIVRYLHSVRYIYLTELFDEFQKQNPNKTINVLELGCAHAKSFELLNSKYNISYVGIEIDENFAQTAKDRFENFSNFRIVKGPAENNYHEFEDKDFIIALETFEHISENIVVRIIENISTANPAYFLCSVPNEIGPVIWLKNIGSFIMRYTRHTEYSWKETFYAGLYQLDKLEAHTTGHKGFDWRWLAQTIRHNRKITATLSNPFRWMPKSLSLSLIFVCKS